MKVGFYSMDITPSLGLERPATYHKLWVEKINDPLGVHACCMTSGETTIAIVGIDTIEISAYVTNKVREALPGIKVCMSPTHTHYGSTDRLPPPWLDEAPELIRKLFLEESVIGSMDYVNHIIRQTVSAVKMAIERQEEADLSFGKGTVEGVTFNRGFKMKSGHRATHPGKGNPEIVDYFEPIDQEAGVVGFWKKGTTEFIGCLTNFSCHGTCDGTGATADWPGKMREAIKAVMGKDCGVVAVYGTAGDITQIDNLSLSPVESGPFYSKVVGYSVAGEIIKLLMKGKRGPVETLRLESRMITIPRRAPSKESVEKALEIVNKWERNTAFHFAKERVCLAEALKHDPNYHVETQLIQIGPLAIATMPGEVFCSIGLAIKEKSPFAYTWVSSLANGAIGYVPSGKVLDEKEGGGYEARLTRGTSTIPEADKIFIDNALEMMQDFTPEEPPTGELIPSRNVVWDFGNNLAERD